MACQITLSPVKQGDTWDGLTNCSFASTGSAFSSPLALVRMQWKDSTGAAALTLSSAVSGEVTITNAASWTFDVPGRILSLSAGVYSIGLETTDSAGVVKTRVTGTQKILADPVT